MRVHLFPFRTQKLSSSAPKILGWKRPGKIGQSQHMIPCGSERTTCSLTSDSRIVGDFHSEGPPVPIPNTEVKLTCAEDTWLEAARENRSSPTFLLCLFFLLLNIPPLLMSVYRLSRSHIHSSIAQSVEHLTVNQGVTGSSPVGGAIMGQQFCTLTQKSLKFKDFSYF